jgi:hypothetical protein
MGTTVAKVSVLRDGSVGQVSIVSAHPVFAKEVTESLKQWKFKPSTEEQSLEITCSFEFYDESCEKPLTAETKVSADLPNHVTIRTGLHCVQDSTSSTNVR